MAGVAQRNTIEVSCPVKQWEFYLVLDNRLRMFRCTHRTTSPVSEAFAATEITPRRGHLEFLGGFWSIPPAVAPRGLESRPENRSKRS